MGTSIDIKWSDGPTEDDVDSVIEHLKGKEFDGSTDSTKYKPTRYMGDDGEIQHRQHTAWVNLSRYLSYAFLSKIANIISKRHGVEPPKIDNHNNNASIDISSGDRIESSNQTIGRMIMSTAYGTSEKELKSLGESIVERLSETTRIADNILIESERIYVPQTATKAVEEWAKKRGVVVRFSKGTDPNASQVHMDPLAKKQFITDFTPGN